MAGFGESKHEPALRETHVSKSLEFADSTARSGGYAASEGQGTTAAPLGDLSSREKAMGPATTAEHKGGEAPSGRVPATAPAQSSEDPLSLNSTFGTADLELRLAEGGHSIQAAGLRRHPEPPAPVTP